MGSVSSGERIELRVELWLRPHLRDYAEFLSGAPHYRMEQHRQNHLLSSVVRLLLKKDAPPITPRFRQVRALFPIIIGDWTRRNTGAWLTEKDMHEVERLLAISFYHSLHNYVRASIDAGHPITVSVRRWMDLHEISGEHYDYAMLAKRLTEGIAYMPPLKASGGNDLARCA